MRTYIMLAGQQTGSEEINQTVTYILAQFCLQTIHGTLEKPPKCNCFLV